jgi:hypothetical protein
MSFTSLLVQLTSCWWYQISSTTMPFALSHFHLHVLVWITLLDC